jgi:hypothetical protein
LAQIEADRKDGLKVVEESIFSCIDDLGLPLTVRQRDQWKEYMYTWLRLYAQRNDYCHSLMMSTALDNQALVTFDKILSNAEIAVGFSPEERQAIRFAIMERRRLHYSHTDGQRLANDGNRQSTAVQRNAARLQNDKK